SGLGAGWKLPLSKDENADPRATAAADLSQSAEALGLYLANIKYSTFWSASSAKDNSSNAYMNDLSANGSMFETAKTDTMLVICVKGPDTTTGGGSSSGSGTSGGASPGDSGSQDECSAKPVENTPASAGTTVPSNTATSGSVPDNTLPLNPPITCQTAEEIDVHVTNADHKAARFCIHKVEHPDTTLKTGESLKDEYPHLKQGIEVAFLNVEKDFDEAGLACTSLGPDWYKPAMNDSSATPQVYTDSSSLESVSVYFGGTTSHVFWSSSYYSTAWMYGKYPAWVDLDKGTISWGRTDPDHHPWGSKDRAPRAICVRIP
ncbi:MAG: hypothetical protein WCO71_01815, partial [Pseudomonadota bacterium]